MDSEVSRTGEITKDSEQTDLPPGFRFHPTDEELISYYLRPKVLNTFFSAIAIGEVDLNKVEPWDIPCKFSYFFYFLYISMFFSFNHSIFMVEQGRLRLRKKSGTSSA